MALKEAGINVLQIFSRTIEASQELANKVNATFTADLQKINSDADLYIISVADNAIEEVASQLDLKDKLVVHTSGSIQMGLLKGASENFGVFYPLQTFSKSKEVNFSTIPICIEANNSDNLEKLTSFAKMISANVQYVDSDQRKVLHLAAVFACNFPNYMYAIADKIIAKADLDFEILRPLIKETAEKVMEINPVEAQTGPANRSDEKIMNEHLKMLGDNPKFQEIYRLISSEIQTLNTEHKTLNK